MDVVSTVPSAPSNTTAQLALGAAAIGVVAGGYAAYKSYKNGKKLEEAGSRQSETSREISQIRDSLARVESALMNQRQATDAPASRQSQPA